MVTNVNTPEHSSPVCTCALKRKWGVYVLIRSVVGMFTKEVSGWRAAEWIKATPDWGVQPSFVFVVLSTFHSNTPWFLTPLETVFFTVTLAYLLLRSFYSNVIFLLRVSFLLRIECVLSSTVSPRLHISLCQSHLLYTKTGSPCSPMSFVWFLYIYVN